MSATNCGIYLIQIGPHFYVGSSKNLHRRTYVHKSHLGKDIHKNKKMQNSFNKYSELCITILEYCAPENLIEREQHYIDEIQPWLNLSKIAGRIEMNEEVCAKISKSKIGNKHALGAIRSKETRARMSEAGKGKPKARSTRRILVSLLNFEQTIQFLEGSTAKSQSKR